MDFLTVVIVLAIGATVATMFLGLLAMSSGGSTDREFSTPLMWTRVGFQALTLILLVVAVLMR
ncbi:twin transmembrane helix small protein [Povalibacter sp.]|uniref:twin transmembrane helix small protein n=1 Tax=Povalibacter sp. TaxID=1962978 RepID=UPI002F42F109